MKDAVSAKRPSRTIVKILFIDLKTQATKAFHT
jgi:hypothetical protein